MMEETNKDPLLYRQLMAIKPGNMTPNAWMLQAGVSRSFLTDLRKRGNARQDSIRAMVEAAGHSMADFYAMPPIDASPEARADFLHSERLPFRAYDEPRDIPMLGTAMGADFQIGETGEMAFAETIDLNLDEVVDYLRRPLALRGRKDVYGFTTVGSSMSPRFEPGDPGYADPRQTPRIGDDVLVYLVKRDAEGEGRIHSVLVKRLLKRTASYIELEQFNPAMSFPVPTANIAMIHRVIPMREMVLF
jgi:hypothetical protein